MCFGTAKIQTKQGMHEANVFPMLADPFMSKGLTREAATALFRYDAHYFDSS